MTTENIFMSLNDHREYFHVSKWKLLYDCSLESSIEWKHQFAFTGLSNLKLVCVVFTNQTDAWGISNKVTTQLYEMSIYCMKHSWWNSNDMIRFSSFTKDTKNAMYNPARQCRIQDWIWWETILNLELIPCIVRFLRFSRMSRSPGYFGNRLEN
jgi:hypothetical protein